MAQRLYHEYVVDTGVTSRDVRAALEQLTDDDVSQSSPISGGAPEAATVLTGSDGESVIGVRVEGHDGEWTKTSERALKSAVKSVEGVTELVLSEGGYETEE